jgi:hypothetical protein
MANQYEKYRDVNRADGKVVMENHTHDAALKLLAQDEPEENIPALLRYKITEEELKALMSDPIAKKRVVYLKSQNRDTQPENLQEFAQFALKKLWFIAQSGKTEDANKIKACEGLGKLVASLKKEMPNLTRKEQDRKVKADTNLDKLEAEMGGK